MIEFIKRNEWSILILAAAAALFYLNSIHSSKGEAEQTFMRYELRKLEVYEQTDPGSKYSPARQMLIRELNDELDELE